MERKNNWTQTIPPGKKENYKQIVVARGPRKLQNKWVTSFWIKGMGGSAHLFIGYNLIAGKLLKALSS